MPRKSREQKIEEALSLLDEFARDKKDELKLRILSDYAHVKELLQGNGKVHEVKEKVQEAIHQGETLAKESLYELEAEIHKSPMKYVGTIAAGAFLLGFVLGSSRK